MLTIKILIVLFKATSRLDESLDHFKSAFYVLTLIYITVLLLMSISTISEIEGEWIFIYRIFNVFVIFADQFHNVTLYSIPYTA